MSTSWRGAWAGSGPRGSGPRGVERDSVSAMPALEADPVAHPEPFGLTENPYVQPPRAITLCSEELL